jgi:hypothetical protein
MNRAGAATPPYMSVLAPMFWIDQDLGWRDLYSPLSTHHFLKDQAVEVVRWFLGLPSKNRIVDTSALKDTKTRLESIREQIQIKQNTLQALQADTGLEWSQELKQSLITRKETALAQLTTYSSVFEALSHSDTAVDQALDEATRKYTAARFALASMERRLAELTELDKELGAEVEILSMSEVAADAFRTLCGSDTCQFFRNPEESYGRRLLYLKDQMKDLDVAGSGIRAEIVTLGVTAAEAEQLVQSIQREKIALMARAQPRPIIANIDALTKEISDLSFRIERGDLIDRENEKLRRLVDLALRLEEEVQELQPRRGPSRDNTRLSDVRRRLVDVFVEWLRALNAQNIATPVDFDEDFRLKLGVERFSENSSTSGSTRTRVVLAFHAALLETSFYMEGNHPPVLVLDTPKQQELHPSLE